MIQEKLKKLGLSSKQIAIYLCILRNSKITPSVIAKKTGISRPTVYSVAKKLIEKGLITEDIATSGTYLIALPPQEITKNIENKKRQIENQFKIAEKLIPELELIPRSQNYSIPKVRFIDSAHVEDFLYNQTENWDKSALERDATWWGFQDSALLKHYSKWLEWYWSRLDPKIEMKMITNIDEKDLSFKGKQQQRRQIKFWTKGQKIKVTQAIIGDYVIIANTAQKPHYLVEIHDAVIAENLRQVFRGIWESL